MVANTSVVSLNNMHKTLDTAYFYILLIFWRKGCAMNNPHQMWCFETMRKGNVEGKESKITP